MTRIIGGSAGSLRLQTPRSITRPTSDRVREAWFSRIAAHRDIAGATVWDLFAGSGALGLEAASRGATDVTLVDNHPAVMTTLTANISALSSALPHAPTLHTVKNTALKFVQAATDHSVDLVFIDPPYDHASNTLTPLLEAITSHLTPGAWVMVERSTRSEPLTWPEGLQVLEPKTYGETTVLVAEKS